MKSIGEQRDLIVRQIIVAQVNPRIMEERFEIQVLSERLSGQSQDSHRIALQRPQRSLLCDLISACYIRFNFLPSWNKMARLETLIVSRGQLLDVKLVALFDDLCQ